MIHRVFLEPWALVASPSWTSKMPSRWGLNCLVLANSADRLDNEPWAGQETSGDGQSIKARRPKDRSRRHKPLAGILSFVEPSFSGNAAGPSCAVLSNAARKQARVG